MATELAGDHPQAAATGAQGHDGNVAAEQGLVTGCCRFVLGRQVDPQLDHFQGAALGGERRRVELFMEDAVGSGHPLHIAGADQAAGTGGVAVFQFALVDDGHGFKAAMRVLADTATRRGRGEVVGAGIVEQQERADVLAQVVVGKQRANRKTVANPMGPWTGVDTDDVFHGVS
ncbi:hypothetical protein D9M73_136840 [compost metagenome]